MIHQHRDKSICIDVEQLQTSGNLQDSLRVGACYTPSQEHGNQVHQDTPSSGDRDKMGLCMGLAQQGPWLGKAGLWRAGDWPCCSLTVSETEGTRDLKWDPVPGLGTPRG